MLYSQHRSPTGTHSFTSQLDGRYNYCFSNEMSTVSPKTLSCVVSPLRPSEQAQRSSFACQRADLLFSPASTYTASSTSRTTARRRRSRRRSASSPMASKMVRSKRVLTRVASA